MVAINLFYVFLVALFASVVLIPPISILAVNMKMVDRPDERKVHLQETPRLGGFAIFFAFLLALFLFGEFNPQTRGFLVGAIIIFLTGLADDLVGLSPRKKFIGEAAAAVCAVLVGQIAIASLGDPFSLGHIHLGPFAIPFTVLAMVGVTNAINLLDGLDGLAAGVTIIAAGAIGVLAFLTGQYSLVIMTVTLIGALIGFLKYNTYPASIFMGDAGSLLLGYCLAFFSVMLVAGSGGRVSEFTPLIILTVPVLDTLYVMTKRTKSGKSMFAADKNHIHHRLMGAGLGHKGTVTVVYGLSYVLSFFAVICYRSPDNLQMIIFLVLVLLFYLTNKILAITRRQGDSPFLRGNLSLRRTKTYRRMMLYAREMRIAMKYLIVVILLLTVFAPVRETGVSVIACLLLLLSLSLLFMTHDWGNRFLLFVLYFDGAFLVYHMENYGRELTVMGLPLIWLTYLLFFVLFANAGLKLFLRRRSARLAASPLEYLILFVAASVPLLPNEFTGSHHLLTVTGESIILIISYKVILMHEAKRNKKIILATLAALCIVALKGLV